MFIVWRQKPVKGQGGGPFLYDKSGDSFSGSRYAPVWREMFRCDHSGKDRIARTPVLLHSERIDGKPRQKLLHRFPTIRSCCIASPRHRAAWWLEVDWFFETLGEWFDVGPLHEDLSRDRSAIMAKLREVVARPPKGVAQEVAARVAEERAHRERAENERRAEWFAHHEGQARERDRDERERRAREHQEQQARASAAFNRFFKRGSDCPYATLGLAYGSPFDAVKSAHRRLVMQHHPDKGGDPERFRAVQDAYETIRDAIQAARA